MFFSFAQSFMGTMLKLAGVFAILIGVYDAIIGWPSWMGLFIAGGALGFFGQYLQYLSRQTVRVRS